MNFFYLKLINYFVNLSNKVFFYQYKSDLFYFKGFNVY